MDMKKIVVQDFRNIELQELEFCPNINCISGNNGEGKTNLMDAIWYLSMTKSAFATSDRYNFRFGCQGFALSGLYSMPSGPDTRISICVDGSGKKLKRDDKPCPRLADHIGLLPVVMVSPTDVAMVSETGEERRRFCNAVLSQMSAEYLNAVQNYTRLLAQRNAMLKTGAVDYQLLDVIDSQMESYAAPVVAMRSSLAGDLMPLVQDFYSRISGGRETVGISYRSDLENGRLTDIFRARREKDSILKYTSVGIQRDDFIFEMNGRPIRRCGSQGQQKSFLVALKFAQYSLMKERRGFAPILLLDDLFDKLDMGRVQNLLTMVAGNDFGQIFLSDSNKVRLSGIVDGITAERTYYEAKGGAFTRNE